MDKLAFLNLQQVSDDNKLELFKEIPISSNRTDFAIITGGYSGYDNNSYYLKNRILDDNRGIVKLYNIQFAGIRLAYPYHNIENELNIYLDYNERLTIVTYGEYPSNSLSNEESNSLDYRYLTKDSKLQQTGKIYHIYNKNKLITVPEFQDDKDNKYVRMKIYNPNYPYYKRHDTKFSDGASYFNDFYTWIKVEPITWYKDTQSGLLISEKILLSGVPYRYTDNIKFEDTDIYKFINDYMLKEIFGDSNLLIDTKENNEVIKQINYPSINERLQEIKKRVKKLQERR